MSEKSLKVTDRRMFTADGELREEYRDLDKDSASTTTAAPTAPQPTTSAPVDTAPPAATSSPAAPPAATPMSGNPPGGAAESDGSSEGAEGPGFFDLVGLLAEPASIYLKEAHSADPRGAAQSLELARLHIDLLSVLRTKTQGNLSPQEDAMLEDVIYQLRAGYVGLRG